MKFVQVERSQVAAVELLIARAVMLLWAVEASVDEQPDDVVEAARDFRAVLTERTGARV